MIENTKNTNIIKADVYNYDTSALCIYNDCLSIYSGLYFE